MDSNRKSLGNSHQAITRPITQANKAMVENSANKRIGELELTKLVTSQNTVEILYSNCWKTSNTNKIL